MVNVDVFLKYKNYFETWLNIPVDKMEKSNGISLVSNEKQKQKLDGWRLLYLPVCAFETENALFISCIPEWEDELLKLLNNTLPSEAIQRMKKFFNDEKSLYCAYHRFFGIRSFDSQIDTTQATTLTNAHCEQFTNFYRKAHPSMSKLIDPKEWMAEDFKTRVDKKIHYCVFKDGEIVSATESENIPNKPDKMVQLGINTLPEYRRRGYAFIACAAFIKNHLQKGLMPVWECDFNNKASEILAAKLGFCHLGNVFYVSSLQL